MHENLVDKRARANGIRANGNAYLMGIIQFGRWPTLTLPVKLFKLLFFRFSLTHSMYFFVVFIISKDI